jgi:hypothetical protein
LAGSLEGFLSLQKFYKSNIKRVNRDAPRRPVPDFGFVALRSLLANQHLLRARHTARNKYRFFTNSSKLISIKVAVHIMRGPKKIPFLISIIILSVIISSCQIGSSGPDDDYIKKQTKEFLRQSTVQTYRGDIRVDDYLTVERADIIEKKVTDKSSSAVVKIHFKAERSLIGNSRAGGALYQVLGIRGFNSGQKIVNEFKFTFSKTENAWEFDNRVEQLE